MIVKNNYNYNYQSRQSGIFKFIIFSTIALILISLMIFTPGAALVEFKNSTAPVVLDGRPILKISSAGEYTAQKRAELIEKKLLTAVSSSKPIDLKVKTDEKLPTIWLNDAYLLTVTQKDVFPGSNLKEQTEIWVEKIEDSVKISQKERSLKFMGKTLTKVGLIINSAIVINWLLKLVWRKYLYQVILFILGNYGISHPEESKSLSILISLSLLVTRIALWVGTILYITNKFPRTRQFSYQFTDTLISTFTSPVIHLGNQTYSVPDLLILVGLVWVLIIGVGGITNILRTRILRVTGINRGAQEAIATMTKYSLITIGAIVLLQVWGLDLSSITLLASAFGVGIGLGFQDIAKNFGSGLVLLFERPIQVGDFVEIGEYQGTVERIGARSTMIKTFDHVSIIVPNSRFLEAELINWDHDHPVSALRLPVGVAYGSNVEEVRQALLDAAAAAYPHVLSMPEPQVLFIEFGDSSLNFELRVWTAEPSKQVIIRSELYFKIEAILRERQIEIPFPQQDLHLRSGNLPIDLSPRMEAMLMQFFQQGSNGKKVNLAGKEEQN
ncbi:mechanosensitive ion channel family protein [Okeania sp. SIO1I7]|uniref:mechanosensitive ion channel family protein n=1 Tax=Okeania sp. SIO1I7 TaxID=2607772 RepID=UPI0013FA4C8C|nr:mechanosensitive ion channel domain-containing protein [Okeania sp. SIO1I7]NET29918.1 mechanosensitive ion channel [Okeania sp. SIO1I7]